MFLNRTVYCVLHWHIFSLYDYFFLPCMESCVCSCYQDPVLMYILSGIIHRVQTENQIQTHSKLNSLSFHHVIYIYIYIYNVICIICMILFGIFKRYVEINMKHHSVQHSTLNIITTFVFILCSVDIYVFCNFSKCSVDCVFTGCRKRTSTDCQWVDWRI